MLAVWYLGNPVQCYGLEGGIWQPELKEQDVITCIFTWLGHWN